MFDIEKWKKVIIIDGKEQEIDDDYALVLRLLYYNWIKIQYIKCCIVKDGNEEDFKVYDNAILASVLNTFKDRNLYFKAGEINRKTFSRDKFFRWCFNKNFNSLADEIGDEGVNYTVLDKVFSSFIKECNSEYVNCDEREQTDDSGEDSEFTWSEQYKADCIHNLQKVLVNVHYLILVHDGYSYSNEFNDLWATCLSGVRLNSPGNLCRLLHYVYLQEVTTLKRDYTKNRYSIERGIIPQVREILDSGLLDKKGFELPKVLLENIPRVVALRVDEMAADADVIKEAQKELQNYIN